MGQPPIGIFLDCVEEQDARRTRVTPHELLDAGHHGSARIIAIGGVHRAGQGQRSHREQGFMLAGHVA